MEKPEIGAIALSKLYNMMAKDGSPLKVDSNTNVFELREPLRATQRKSYKHENRYLSPCPILTVKEVRHVSNWHFRHSMTSSQAYRGQKITGGIVSVELVDVDGRNSAESEKMTDFALQGGQQALVDPKTLSTSKFQLKVRSTTRSTTIESEISGKFLTSYRSLDVLEDRDSGWNSECVTIL